MGGLAAAKRGECDIAGVHLHRSRDRRIQPAAADPEPRRWCRATGACRASSTGAAMRASRAGRVDEAVAAALRGRRLRRWSIATPAAARASSSTSCSARARPPGYGVQTKSHNAVAAAVAQGRADWGVAIDTVARQYGLGFIRLQEERYDFIVPTARLKPLGRAGILLAAPRSRGPNGTSRVGIPARRLARAHALHDDPRGIASARSLTGIRRAPNAFSKTSNTPGIVAPHSAHAPSGVTRYASMRYQSRTISAVPQHGQYVVPPSLVVHVAGVDVAQAFRHARCGARASSVAAGRRRNVGHLVVRMERGEVQRHVGPELASRSIATQRVELLRRSRSCRGSAAS